MKSFAYVLLAACLLAFVLFLHYATKMTTSAKNGHHLFRREVGYNPFYSFYRPDLLNLEGKAYRMRAGYAFLAFIVLLTCTILLWS